MDKSLRRALVVLIWTFTIVCFIIPFIAFVLFLIYDVIITS